MKFTTIYVCECLETPRLLCHTSSSQLQRVDIITIYSLHHNYSTIDPDCGRETYPGPLLRKRGGILFIEGDIRD